MYILSNLINFFFANNKMRCIKCYGSGLMELDQPIICKNCKGKICYLCENKGSIQIIKECDSCYGTGTIRKTIN